MGLFCLGEWDIESFILDLVERNLFISSLAYIISCVLSLDVNECKENSSCCNQICSNKPGSYECSCRPGYKLNADNCTCEGNVVYGKQIRVSMC